MQGAYEHETFNEQTGIGETKHGLPLGCLNIKLIRLDGMEGDPQVSTTLALYPGVLQYPREGEGSIYEADFENGFQGYLIEV